MRLTVKGCSLKDCDNGALNKNVKARVINVIHNKLNSLIARKLYLQLIFVSTGTYPDRFVCILIYSVGKIMFYFVLWDFSLYPDQVLSICAFIFFNLTFFWVKAFIYKEVHLLSIHLIWKQVASIVTFLLYITI